MVLRELPLLALLGLGTTSRLSSQRGPKPILTNHCPATSINEFMTELASLERICGVLVAAECYFLVVT